MLPTLDTLAYRYRLTIVSNIDDDLLRATPLGLTIAWINRRGMELSVGVPRPAFVFPDIAFVDRLMT